VNLRLEMHIKYNEYIDLVNLVYKEDKNFRTNCEDIIINLFEHKGSFCNNAKVVSVGVLHEAALIAGCFLVIPNNYKDSVLVCFFEALPNYQEAVNLIINYAGTLGRKNNCKNITIGLNTHINAGAGILVEEFSDNSYGNNYNPPYYVDYFKSLKANIHTLTSYKGDIKDFSLSSIDKVIKRVNNQFTFREICLENFREDMASYTKLANEAFANHKFYYQRKVEEDYELYEPMLTILKPENILFAEKNGELVGCLIWYPNYYEQCTRSIKVIEIGVLPRYRKSGVAVGLLNECYKRIKVDFDYMESGWILDGNFLSKSMANRWMKKVHKRFNIYELNLEKRKEIGGE
jgi:hypothetical protein